MTIQSYFQVVKMVLSSAVNEDGEELYSSNLEEVSDVQCRDSKRNACPTQLLL